MISILVLAVVGSVACHVSFDPFALKLIREKFERKIDTNYFVYDKAVRQREGSIECTSEDGPYCSFLNGHSFNSEVETSNIDYLAVKNVAMANLNYFGADILGNTRKSINSGSDYLFYDQRRSIFDELLYPHLFYRKMLLIFTFETFAAGQDETAISHTVDYTVESSHFNTLLYPQLAQDVRVFVEITGLYTPSSTAPLMEVGLKTIKNMINSFGILASDSQLEEIKFGKNPPQGLYVFTRNIEGRFMVTKASLDILNL